jgi:CheY-like chemotaxis protein
MSVRFAGGRIMGCDVRIAPRQATMPGEMRVLIVEDHPFVAIAAAEMVGSFGHSWSSAVVDTVDEALDLVGDGDIAVAMLDFNLDGQTSAPIADALLTRGIPFLVTTGFGGSLPGSLGGAPRLMKPYLPSQLRAGLVALLG